MVGVRGFEPPAPASRIPHFSTNIRGRTTCERPSDRNRFTTVYAQAVLAAHIERSFREPGRVSLRLPLGGVFLRLSRTGSLAHFPASRSAHHVQTGSS